MTGTELRKVVRAQPFQPFKVFLADGRHVEVNHPELLLYAPGARTFVVACDDGSYEHVDLLLVTSIRIGNDREPRPPSA